MNDYSIDTIYIVLIYELKVNLIRKHTITISSVIDKYSVHLSIDKINDLIKSTSSIFFDHNTNKNMY